MIDTAKTFFIILGALIFALCVAVVALMVAVWVSAVAHGLGVPIELIAAFWTLVAFAAFLAAEMH